ncbi:hypothetical protein BSKO_12002 [Bryopsis sp. KO-2023]|nr:hypothetical protein BSKO_12002 [Bryopsis sp. KO-2023]
MNPRANLPPLNQLIRVERLHIRLGRPLSTFKQPIHRRHRGGWSCCKVMAIAGYCVAYVDKNCSSLQNCRVEFPSHFSLLDTMREPKARWVGVGILVVMGLLIFVLALFRHYQVTELCSKSTVDLHSAQRYNTASVFVAGGFSIFLIATAAINPCAKMSWTNLAAPAGVLVTAILYAHLHLRVDRIFAGIGAIRPSMRFMRIFLAFFAVSAGVVAAAMVVVKLLLGLDENTQGFRVFELFLVGTEYLAIFLGLGFFGLTDFASMAVDMSRLTARSTTAA